MRTTGNENKMAVVDDAQADLQQLIDEITEISSKPVSDAEFYQRLIDCLQPITAAVNVAVWHGKGEQWSLLCQSGINHDKLFHDPQQRSRHSFLLREATAHGRVRIAWAKAIRRDSSTDGAAGYVLAFFPVLVNQQVRSVFQVIQPANQEQPTDQITRLILALDTEVASAYHRSEEARQLHELCAWHEQLHEFNHRLQTLGRMREVVYCIANDGRCLLDCDRLSLALRKHRKVHLRAVSGQEVINRRANSVRYLQRLTKAVLSTGGRLWYPHDVDNLPPQIESALSSYVDESHVKSLMVLPLTAPTRGSADPSAPSRRPKLVGGLILEHFSELPADKSIWKRLSLVGQQSSLALHRAKRFTSSAWRTFSLRRIAAMLLLSSVLAAGVALLIVIPADFTLFADGTLQPVLQRHVFAPSDGVVDELLVTEGQQLEAGETLAVLRNPDLDVRIEAVRGELRAKQDELAAIKTSLLVSPAAKQDPVYYNDLVSRQEELSQWLGSLQKQYDMLLEQQQTLQVKSRIGGEVITWDVERRLASRPVKQGQLLMTIAELSGPWHLELMLPDHDAGHLFAAQRDLADDLKVTFIVATNPNKRLAGRLVKVAESTRLDETRGQYLRIKVDFDEREIKQLVPGLGVTGRIHCGQRPVGYVWFRELFEFIQAKVLFRLGLTPEMDGDKNKA